MREKTNEIVKEMNLADVEAYGWVTQLGMITCPYCGEEWVPDYGDYESAPYQEYEEQCFECDEYFLLDCEPEIRHAFSSKRIEVTE